MSNRVQGVTGYFEGEFVTLLRCQLGGFHQNTLDMLEGYRGVKTEQKREANVSNITGPESAEIS